MPNYGDGESALTPMTTEWTAEPTITEIPWLTAREVLGGEASDFTPWLVRHDSLEILGRSLKLDDLTPVMPEHNVLGKRLDILARAIDEDGDEIPVCIENQYGTSDPNHLGRLIAYLAQQERGRAVWLVEDAHDAYVAAVRFLNRTSTDEAGYYLVRVRFARAPESGFHVHFDVLAAPIAWEGSGRRGPGSRLANPEKVTFLTDVGDAIGKPLRESGFSPRPPHARGAYLRVQWPTGHWFRQLGEGFDVRVTGGATSLAIYIEKFSTKDENVAAAEILQERYQSALDSTLPSETECIWDFAGTGHRKPIKFELEGEGYVDGDASTAAQWLVSTCRALLGVFDSDPIPDLFDEVESRVPQSTLDD